MALIAAQVLGQTISLIKFRMRLHFMTDVYLVCQDTEALRIAGDTTQTAYSTAVQQIRQRRRDSPTSGSASALSVGDGGPSADVAAALERVMQRQATGTPAEGALLDSP